VIPGVHNSHEIVLLKSLTRIHSGENPCVWLQVNYTVSWWDKYVADDLARTSKLPIY